MTVMALMAVHSSTDSTDPPSFAEAAAQLGVSVDDIDPTFGIIPVDLSDGLYAVQVRADRLPPGTNTAKPFGGPFSNPKTGLFEIAAPASDSSEQPASTVLEQGPCAKNRKSD